MLDKRHLQAIDLLLDGNYSINEILEEVGISRTTFYYWRTENEEFIKCYNSRLQKQKELGEKIFTEKVTAVTDELFKIISNPKSTDSNKIQAITYWLNRVYGTPTNSMQLETRDRVDEGTSEEDILDVFDEDE